MNRSILISIFLVLALSGAASSIPQKRVSGYGDISGARFIKNYDGDTITVDIPGYPPIIGDDISIRLNGIDTPEIKGKCEKEKRLARQAKQQVASLLINARNIELRNIRRGKYFRIVADVWADNESVSQILIDKRLAVQYNGGRKKSHWCK